MGNRAPEFKVGDIVTYRPFETSTKMEVAEVDKRDFIFDKTDRRMFYGLRVGRGQVTTITTGISITESKLFVQHPPVRKR